MKSKSKMINTISFAPERANETIKILACSAIAIALALFVAAAKVTAQQASDGQSANGKHLLGPRPELQQAYRPAPRDPFKRAVKKPELTAKAKAKAAGLPRPVAFPSLDARRAEFKRLVDVAIATDRPEPDPVSQYLVSELDVTGVFRDANGYGAFVRAQPTGTMFFVRGGVRVYNGELLRIEGDEAGSAQAVFREVSYVELDGKKSPQERVVTKVPTTASLKKK